MILSLLFANAINSPASGFPQAGRNVAYAIRRKTEYGANMRPELPFVVESRFSAPAYQPPQKNPPFNINKGLPALIETGAPDFRHYGKSRLSASDAGKKNLLVKNGRLRSFHRFETLSTQPKDEDLAS